jgi:hypothetical protein
MSTTATAVGATNTPASSCGALLYDIPTSDAACAMPYRGNHTDVMAECCSQVVSYLDDCGLYCLAQGETIADLTECLYENGAAFQDVFCNDLTNATATATGDAAKPTASGASVVASNGAKTTGGSGDDGDDDNDGDSGSSSNDDDDSAAVSVRGLSSVGISVVALLLSSTIFGALLV